MRVETQLALAFASGATLAAAAAVYAQCNQRRSWSRWWKANVSSAESAAAALKANQQLESVGVEGALNDDIMKEHFTRNIQFFGHEGQQRIFQSAVVVIGLGVCSDINKTSCKCQAGSMQQHLSIRLG